MVTTTTYDALARPVAVTVNTINGAGTGTSDLNRTTSTAYDDLGRVQTSTDPTGTATRYEYDRLGRVTKTYLNYVDGTAGSASSDDDVESRVPRRSGSWSRRRRTEAAGRRPSNGRGVLHVDTLWRRR